MLSRDEEIINTYLDGCSIKEISDRFSYSEEDIRAKIIQYRVQRVIVLTANMEYNDDNLGVISKYVEESVLNIDSRSGADERRKICNIIKMIEDGMTLESVGDIFSVTRERIRQIIKKYSPELVVARESRKFKDCEICGQNKKGVRQRGKDKLIMCEPCHEETIKFNKNRWARSFDKCIDCGTTKVPHKIKGRCEKCYILFSYHYDLNRRKSIKKSSKKWRIKNIARVRETNKRASERIKKQALGGNRELALRRDEYKCNKCCITQEESLTKYGRDLFVSHIKDIKDDRLDNLITLCSACHNDIHSRNNRIDKNKN